MKRYIAAVVMGLALTLTALSPMAWAASSRVDADGATHVDEIDGGGNGGGASGAGVGNF